MGFSQAERAFILESYFKSQSFLRCQEDFTVAFPETKVPNKSTISRIVARFRKTGSVNDCLRSGRPSVLSDDSLENIRASLLRSPRKSIRKLCQQTGMSYGSVRRATKKLKLRPYRIHVVHELQEPDRGKRLQYCQWFLRFIHNSVQVLDYVFYSDEAWFHLSGYVNSQNNRYWSSENPNVFHETPLHSRKVGVWCAISRKRIVGPIFFTETITAERYQDIIMQFVALLEADERHCWLQQDGATAHTANSTMIMLREFFGEHIISRGLWPPRSPDLSPPDFFLWGHLKDNVYKNNPHTIDQLKHNIEDEISRISVATTQKVATNMTKRVNACVAADGGHFQHLL